MSGAPATPPNQYSRHRHGENEFPFVRVMMKPFFFFSLMAAEGGCGSGGQRRTQPFTRTDITS